MEQVSLTDYYIPQKVSAFIRSFAPCDTEAEATEVFNDHRLRQYFQAYPIPMVGDLLTLYIETLDQNGYPLQTSVTGEPAIFVTTKEVENPLLTGLLTPEETTDEENTAHLLENAVQSYDNL